MLCIQVKFKLLSVYFGSFSSSADRTLFEELLKRNVFEEVFLKEYEFRFD